MRTGFFGISVLVVCSLIAGCSRDIQAKKREFVQSGDKYLAAGSTMDAIIQYRNAIALDNSFGEARYKLAGAYDRLGDGQNALREYIRAADLLPDNVDAQVRAGNGLLMAGQYPEARARATAALNKDPKNIAALITLGNAMAGMKDMQTAISTVEQAVDTDPSAILAYTNLGALQLAKGDRAAAENAFKRATEINPKDENARLALANYYWALGQIADAERELRTAYANGPKSIAVNRALSVFYTGVGRAAESEQYLKTYASLSSEVEATLALADFYILANRADDARAVLDPLLKADNNRRAIPAAMRLAALDFTAGKRDDAHKRLDGALKRESNNEPALLEKGRFLLIEKKPTEALSIAEGVLRANPRSASAFYLKGTALAGTGAIDEAIAAFEETAKLAPREMAPLLQLAQMHYGRGHDDQAAQFAVAVLRKAPTSGVAHLVLAKVLIRQNNLKAAESEVKGLLAGNSGRPEVQVLAGDFYWARQELQPARTAYEKALSLEPRSVEANAGLIRIDLTEKHVDAASTRLDALLAKYPDDPAVLTLAGSAFTDMKDVKRSEAVFRHLMEVDPSNFQAYAALGAIYASQRRLDEAVHEYDEVARLNKKAAPAALTMAGTILTMQGKADTARDYYQRALSVDPQMPIAANNLAWDYAENGRDLDVALNLAQMAKSKLPNNATVSDTLGWVYYKKGLASMAVSSLEEAARLDPSDPGILYRQAMAYVANGDKDKARRSVERALSMNRDFKEAAEARRLLPSLVG